MITETLIRKMEAKTAAIRKDAVARLGKEIPFDNIRYLLIGCDLTEVPYQKMMQDQLRIEEVKKQMKAKKKGMTKNQKLKMLKTSKAKKLVKSTKK